MTAIDQYTKLKAKIAEAKAWAALAVPPATGKIVDVVFDCAIYDKDAPSLSGLPKPERMPNSMQAYAIPEAKQKADNIIAGAIARMEAELVTLAEAARLEYQQIAADAGLNLP
jgi:Fe-S cluster assembly scaffold protein SufB